jgi:hypothetical protein
VTSRHPGIWVGMSFGQTTAKAVREIRQTPRVFRDTFCCVHYHHDRWDVCADGDRISCLSLISSFDHFNSGNWDTGINPFSVLLWCHVYVFNESRLSLSLIQLRRMDYLFVSLLIFIWFIYFQLVSSVFLIDDIVTQTWIRSHSFALIVYIIYIQSMR